MKIKFLIALLFQFTLGFGQNLITAQKLVEEGIEYHDKGDYKTAISKYDDALKLDKDNLYALAEKSLSLFYSGENEKAANICKLALDKHGKTKDQDLQNIYVTYGNSLDHLEKKDEAIKIFNKGIKEFPDYYQLYYNKGITLVKDPKTLEEALVCFQEAIIKNPNHASSHNALGRMLKSQDKRIPSILAFCRFLTIEPNSKRASENLDFLNSYINENVSVTGENSITINLDPSKIPDGKGKVSKNDFSTSDMILSMDVALDHDTSNKNKSDVEKFTRKIETLVATFKESKKHKGFYWDYYVPYFIEMSDKKFIETFSYIIHTSSNNKETQDWLAKHDKEIQDFFTWSKNFQWKKK